ncbi:DMT family transporter [Kineococcus arenarius]|uniref:DMT family transporter n=1 Tax=unclassified Kineococcus TaxID=2621656 RepID=UPI003D7CB666
MSKPIGIPRRRGAAVSVALGALFVVCWSSGFVGAKLGAQDADVRTVLMWRLLPLAAVLVPVTLVRRRRTADREGSASTNPRGEALRQVGIGALSQSGYLLTVYWAIGLGVSTGTTALIDGVQPLVVAALAGPLLGAAVSGRQWTGLLVGLAGVLAVTWADATSPRTGAPAWAYAIPFAGMLCLVAATFLERRARCRPRPLHNLTIHCTTSAVVFTAVAVLGGAATVPDRASFWIATAWLVVFPTFGGYGLYWLLMDRVGVTTVNSLMFLVPPVTTAWGAVMFGEPVTALTVGGLALALVATWLVNADRPAAPARVRAPVRTSASAPTPTARRR